MGSPRVIEWGQHRGWGWDSEINIFSVLRGQHGMLSGSARMAALTAARVVEWGQARCVEVRLTNHMFLFMCAAPTTGGWVGSNTGVRVRLRNLIFLFMWGHQGWLSGVKHGGLGWDSEINMFSSCGASTECWVGQHGWQPDGWVGSSRVG